MDKTFECIDCKAVITGTNCAYMLSYDEKVFVNADL